MSRFYIRTQIEPNGKRNSHPWHRWKDFNSDLPSANQTRIELLYQAAVDEAALKLNRVNG